MSRERDDRDATADLLRDLGTLDGTQVEVTEAAQADPSSPDAQLLDLLRAGRKLASLELPAEDAERVWQRLRVALRAPVESAGRSLRPLWLGACLLTMGLLTALLIRAFTPAPQQSRPPIRKEQYLRLETGGKTVSYHLIVHE